MSAPMVKSRTQARGRVRPIFIISLILFAVYFLLLSNYENKGTSSRLDLGAIKGAVPGHREHRVDNPFQGLDGNDQNRRQDEENDDDNDVYPGNGGKIHPDHEMAIPMEVAPKKGVNDLKVESIKVFKSMFPVKDQNDFAVNFEADKLAIKDHALNLERHPLVPLDWKQKSGDMDPDKLEQAEKSIDGKTPKLEEEKLDEAILPSESDSDINNQGPSKIDENKVEEGNLKLDATTLLLDDFNGLHEEVPKVLQDFEDQGLKQMEAAKNFDNIQKVEEPKVKDELDASEHSLDESDEKLQQLIPPVSSLNENSDLQEAADIKPLEDPNIIKQFDALKDVLKSLNLDEHANLSQNNLNNLDLLEKNPAQKDQDPNTVMPKLNDLFGNNHPQVPFHANLGNGGQDQKDLQKETSTTKNIDVDKSRAVELMEDFSGDSDQIESVLQSDLEIGKAQGLELKDVAIRKKRKVIKFKSAGT